MPIRLLPLELCKIFKGNGSRGTDTNGGGGESGGACLIMAKVQSEWDINSEHLLLCTELQV